MPKPMPYLGFSIVPVCNFCYEVEYEMYTLPADSPAAKALVLLMGDGLAEVAFHRTRGIEPPDNCNSPYVVMRRNPRNPGYALLCVEVRPGQHRVIEANFNVAKVPAFAALVRKAP